MAMVRTALRAALVLCLASACSDDSDPSPRPGGPGNPDRPGDDPGRPPGDDPSGAQPVGGAVRGGQLHYIGLAAPLGPNADHAMLLGAVESDLESRLGRLIPERFAVRGEFAKESPGGGRLRYVDMVQRVRGVPIHDTYLHLVIRDDGGAANIVGSSFRLYRDPRVDTRPAVDSLSAANVARQSLRLGSAAAIRRQALEVRDLGGVLELVWATAVVGSYNRVLMVASGSRTGKVVLVDERVSETVGTVAGFSVTGGAPGGLGVVGSVDVANADVTAPSGQTSTDPNGNFVLDVPADETISVGLIGRAAVVFDDLNDPVLASGPAGPTLDLVLGSEVSTEEELAQITAYVETDRSRAFALANGIPSEALGGPLATFVNVTFGTCNAFYDPSGPSTAYLHSGGACNNAATDSIVTHEYGHFVDDMMGGITNSGLSEGWGDLLSCYRLGISEQGFDLFPGQATRNCENDYVFPPGGVDQQHALGQAWMGFAWRVRQGLIAKHGDTGGEALARALVFPSLNSNAPDILHAVREVFLRDDDDGDLSNQTPNSDVLLPAAEHHGVAIALDLDAVPPAAVSDLTAASVSATSVTLAWTAPGDDAGEGTAALYQVRASSSPITPENFPSAALVAGPPTPGPAGTPETMTVTVAPATRLFFALVASDEQFNVSTLSNVLEVTTPEGNTVFHEGAEDGLNGFTATGLWHVTARRASEGVQAFWYGQEETGNYDTGLANSGTLTSPTIDLGNAVEPVLSFKQFVEVEADFAFDRFRVIVNDVDDPTNTAVLEKDTISTAGEFASRTLSLAAFAGRRVQLTFSFDTLDSALNRFEGWYVDDIRIVSAAAECAHDVCEAGAALEPGCSPCAATVCEVDSFCCEVFWDRICVQEAEALCGDTCTGCAHDLCDQGEPLEATCDPCAETVCAADPFCCENAWDARCISEASQLCGLACAECTHDLCQPGGPLSSTCDPCVAAVCEDDPYCCGTSWDERCVAAVDDVCGLSCASAR